MYDLCYVAWVLFSLGGGWVATLSGATRSPQAISRLFSDVLMIPSRSPDPAPELGLYVWLPAGHLRSGATQGPQTPQGPSWCHRFPPPLPPPAGPHLAECEVTQGTGPGSSAPSPWLSW